MEDHEKHELSKVLFYLVYMWLTFKGEEGTGFQILKVFAFKLTSMHF